MSYLVDESGYSLAVVNADAIARRARMSGNIPDPGPMSPKAYDQEIRYPQWREARRKACEAERPAAPAPAPKEHRLAPSSVWLRRDIERIMRAVSDFYKVSLIDLRSRRRTASVVRPRQIAMYLARTLSTRSLPEIGRRMGGRDHTTVLHGYEKIKALRLTDEALDAVLRILEARLSDAPQPEQVIYYGA